MQNNNTGPLPYTTGKIQVKWIENVRPETIIKKREDSETDTTEAQRILRGYITN